MNFQLFFYGVVLFLVLLVPANYTFDQDEIKNLPGVDFQLNFRQFSGYLDGGKGRQLFYWFVESVNNPTTDPVMLWLNGGPGCSSLCGLFTENGPFRVKSNFSSLELDPFSWNQLGNVLYLESPFDVGFSYNQSKLDREDMWNDEAATDAKYNALVDFFQKYPQFKFSDFYINGESYCGIYIPLLARKVLERNHLHQFNLKGISIGNGVYDFAIEASSRIDFIYSHGLIGMDVWRELKLTCCHGSIDTVDQCDYPLLLPKNSAFIPQNQNMQCSQLVNNLMKGLTDNINWYNVYDDCEMYPDPVSHLCVNQFYGYYLNLPEVRKALHVDSSLTERDWIDCNKKIFEEYNIQYLSMDGVFKDLLDKHNFSNIVLYNGDIDLVCDFQSAQRFLFLKMKLITSSKSKYWKVWEYDNQLSGVETHFENGMRYFTVHGAGHKVAIQKPKQLLAIIKDLLNVQKIRPSTCSYCSNLFYTNSCIIIAEPYPLCLFISFLIVLYLNLICQ